MPPHWSLGWTHKARSALRLDFLKKEDIFVVLSTDFLVSLTLTVTSSEGSAFGFLKMAIVTFSSSLKGSWSSDVKRLFSVMREYFFLLAEVTFLCCSTGSTLTPPPEAVAGGKGLLDLRKLELPDLFFPLSVLEVEV